MTSKELADQFAEIDRRVSLLFAEMERSAGDVWQNHVSHQLQTQTALLLIIAKFLVILLDAK